MKIMMIAPTSFFGDYGGHIRIYEETLALQRLGHTVTIVTYYKGRDLDDITIERTAALPWRTEYEVGSSRHKFAFDAYLAAKAWRVAMRLKPDVIHGHMHEGALIGWPIARMLKVPLVFDFQGSLTGEMVDHGFLRKGSPIFRGMRRLERFICARPSAILTSSVRARAMLHDEFRVATERIHPLPDCVDLERFNPAKVTPERRQALRAELGIPSGRIVIAYLGLLAEYQGTSHLLHAAAKHKAAGVNSHFLIMGYPNVDRYKQAANDLGVSDCVTFTGKMPYGRAPVYLSLGDIAVSAKMSKTEGSGKVLNYMAMGQPVAAYESPVHREFLGDLGCYAPLGDVDALADVLAALVVDEEKRVGLGRAFAS